MTSLPHGFSTASPDIRERAERLAATIFAVGLVNVDNYVNALASALLAEREAGRAEATGSAFQNIVIMGEATPFAVFNGHLYILNDAQSWDRVREIKVRGLGDWAEFPAPPTSKAKSE